MSARPRAVYRGYWQGGKRSARVTRLHIVSEDKERRSWVPEWSGARTLCGQSATQHRNSEPVIIDPMPDRPPEGLSWCPMCIGHLAEQLGVLGDVAARLAERSETAATGRAT